MLDRQAFKLADDGIGTPTSDFGFGAGGVRDHLVLGQRGGERVDELEVAQVVENGAAPFGQRVGQVPAGLLEAAGRGGVHTGGLLDHESADVAVGVGGVEPIPRRCVDQHRLRIGARPAEQLAQVRDVGVQAGPGLGRRPLPPTPR